MQIDELSIGGTGKVPLIMSLIIAFGGIYCLTTKNVKIKFSFNFLFLIWLIGTVVNAWFIFKSDNINTPIMQTLMSISNYILFCVFGKIGLQYRNINVFFDRIVIVLVIALLVTYIQTYNIMHWYFSGDDYIAGPSYYLLMLLPFAFCIKKKTWRWLCVIIIIIIQLSSVKRGGTIALFLALIAYYIVKHFYAVRNKHFFRRLFILIVLFSLAYYSFVIFDKAMNNGMLVSRLDMMGQGDASMRNEIYESVWNGVKKSTVTELLFGHGAMATQKITQYNLTAHNDFLEVLYNYGVLMFILYLWFYALFIRFIKRLIEQRSLLTAPLAVCFTLFFVLSIVSHIIISAHFVTLVMFLGYAEGRFENERQIKKFAI